MEGRILTCVYCGHEYPQDTPAHGDKVLAGMIGASTKEELGATELVVRSLPGCEEDRAGEPLAECMADYDMVFQRSAATGRISRPPLPPRSYRAAAQAIRRMADHLEARADAASARDKAARTQVIHRLSRYCREFSERHRAGG